MAPDAIIVPIGCGTNISSYYKGFLEYFQLGLISKFPKLIGVQAETAAPVVKSFLEKKSTVEAEHPGVSVASAIAVADPIDGVKALDAIYRTGGLATAVSDEEILVSQKLLAQEEGFLLKRLQQRQSLFFSN